MRTHGKYEHKDHRIIVNEMTGEKEPFWCEIQSIWPGAWYTYSTAYYSTVKEAATVAVGIVNNRMRITKNTVIR